MTESIKKRLKYFDMLLQKTGTINHKKSRDAMIEKIKMLRNKVAQEIGK